MNIKVVPSLRIGKEGDLTVKKCFKTADFTQNGLKCHSRMIAINRTQGCQWNHCSNHSVGYVLKTGASITDSRLSKQELSGLGSWSLPPNFGENFRFL